jgi:hypothetical protein
VSGSGLGSPYFKNDNSSECYGLMDEEVMDEEVMGEMVLR